MRRALLSALACLAAFPLSASGALWIVEADSSDAVGRIGGVYDLAASGDTIRVGPGLFYEHILLTGKVIRIESSDGPEATIIDGSVEIPGREKAIIYSDGTTTESISLEGLTFTKGGGATGFAGAPSGGAICIMNQTIAGTSMSIRNCVFEDNESPWPDGGGGGAVFARAVESVTISRSRFRGNFSHGFGGSVATMAGTVAFTDCDFDLGASNGQGFAISVYTNRPCTIDSCRFLSDEPGAPGSWVWINGPQAEVTRSTFMDRGGGLGRLLSISDLNAEAPGNVSLQSNVFWESQLDAEVDVDLFMGETTMNIVGNTLSNAALYIQTVRYVVVANNIFHGEASHARGYMGGRIACNDAYPDSVVTGWGTFELENNVNADPRFCDPASGDLTLSVGSPCTEVNSPAGCGLIGALGIGCNLPAVRPTTWGALKAGFRARPTDRR